MTDPRTLGTLAENFDLPKMQAVQKLAFNHHDVRCLDVDGQFIARMSRWDTLPE